MNSLPLLGRLLHRRRRAGAAGEPLRLQVSGLDAAQLRQLEQLLRPLDEQLAIAWQLVADDADVVLVAGGAAPGPAAADGGPVLVCDLPRAGETADEAAARFERRQRQLLAQLRALPPVRRRSPHFGASGWDPEFTETQPGEADDNDLADEDGWSAPSLPLEHERLLRRLRQVWVDRSPLRVCASYGAEAQLELDFELGQAWLDLGALRALRVHRRLPVLLPEGRAGREAVCCELAQVLWELGLAAGTHRLLDQPLDWWNARIAATDAAALAQRARMPQHSRLAIVLAAGPATAQALCQRGGVPLPAVRAFLQAALLLRLVRWER